MPSNHTGRRVRELAARYPDGVGHLLGPELRGWRTPFLPYALDNGAYRAWKEQVRWQQKDYLGLCEKAVAFVEGGGWPPMFLTAPDVVRDRAATIEKWLGWHSRLRSWYGWPLAFVLQDGMQPADIPAEADWIFIGGSKPWKWRTIQHWDSEGWAAAAGARRVHVGRVNGFRMALQCARIGAASIDGTGWGRTDRQRAGLEKLVAHLSAGRLDNPAAGHDLFHAARP